MGSVLDPARPSEGGRAAASAWETACRSGVVGAAAAVGSPLLSDSSEAGLGAGSARAAAVVA